ncbi:MAG: hypothetical protein NC310_07110 [Roseburia sp.]|nr:hypothetical protein [Anaeroplasma bactoclasticum]MCM1196817.1 hypothetical protein [Roseburia sp.]MCM1556953.1 hypothetical protein [Anaeroplasma bactoclasticum]
MEKDQVKSKERVRDHGEVFTNEREVNAMLDLVKEETENIESTFLEPACGDGNFLAEILKRKLNVVKERYHNQLDNYEMYSISAIASIYGVDILQDNVNDCIERLYDIWLQEYSKIMKTSEDERVKQVCHYILTKNILCGDALTMLKNDGTPIVFAEWKFGTGTMIKRRDYELSKILETEQLTNTEEFNLFTFDDDINKDVRNSVDKPIKEYPLVDYREVVKYE